MEHDALAQGLVMALQCFQELLCASGVKKVLSVHVRRARDPVNPELKEGAAHTHTRTHARTLARARAHTHPHTRTMFMYSMDFRNTKYERFMNSRVPSSKRYQPTEYEHAANCATHGFWIIPSIVGSSLLYFLSDDKWESITAWLYGTGLSGLFIMSTMFHTVSWKKSHLQNKILDLICYTVMGAVPAIVLLSMPNREGVMELSMGGVFYCLGVVFFKSDGLVPFAHAIWHIFVAIGAAIHYYAIWRYLYATGSSHMRSSR
ncbi:monocyte to macrophage differentiation factor 2a isoform X2 [Pangasianodon hypophthalmus]|uniref:monocyte to macrophage differentiation factor 2a isoform X2 n=1 Tax=Pangasianodon hypophthalmus TaxID=310915 RepID=UPI0023072A3F|nr:monocyte to macrophage differentiation factor 2a isoform X2 [Pangasianodon hypophthalmus]